jgi:hypothetical protein
MSLDTLFHFPPVDFDRRPFEAMLYKVLFVSAPGQLRVCWNFLVLMKLQSFPGSWVPKDTSMLLLQYSEPNAASRYGS